MPDFDRGTVDANGLEFHYLEAGSGPLALCVHGFPDSPWTYRHLLPELANAGYRAVAPFNRGFAPTQLPADRHHVHTSTMVADVLALHEALGGDGDAVLHRARLGRGRGVGRRGQRPERWSRCVILNIPPFEIFGENIVHVRPDQALVLLLVLPAAAGHRDGRSRRTTSSSSTASGATGRRATTRPRTCPWSRTASATRSTCRPRSATTGASSTRPASARRTGRRSRRRRGATACSQPTLYLHGTNDGCHGMTAGAGGPRARLLRPGLGGRADRGRRALHARRATRGDQRADHRVPAARFPQAGRRDDRLTPTNPTAP